MDDDWRVTLEQNMVGRRCSVERREADWAINLDGGANVSLPIPWRIIAEGRIAFADEDDGQRFGLPSPVDGEAEANRLLAGKAITRVTVHQETADLTLDFEAGVRLEAFSNSSGYEGWKIILPRGSGGLWIIALGGGGVAVFDNLF
ncbi:DUF6188 family protein [Inquilinus limosus]|uniref:Uncharacterized protein n=1 Tax=Inquilinus limosus TaxID=171674 RepID=A0A211Z193_9PROT|nr:DUF6188 family protein [Inquilinus limosus]OWJ59026.1 hypothetical protein BWR60_32825 [Inquilinus limosus]